MQWAFYAALSLFGFIIVFVSFKIAGNMATPLLFALIVHIVNFLGHVFLVVMTSKKKMTESLHISKTMLWLAFVCGCFTAVNDTAIIYMFKTGGPISLAVPIFLAVSVFLTAVFGILIMKEKLSFRRICGLVLIVVSIVMLNV